MGKTRELIDKLIASDVVQQFKSFEGLRVLADEIDDEAERRADVGERANDAIALLVKYDARLAALEHAQPQGNEDAVRILSTEYQRVLSERNEARKERDEALRLKDAIREHWKTTARDRNEAWAERDTARTGLAEAQGKLKCIWERCGGEYYSIAALRLLTEMNDPPGAKHALLLADVLEILKSPATPPPCPRCNDSGVLGGPGFEAGEYSDTTRECECMNTAEEPDDPSVFMANGFAWKGLKLQLTDNPADHVSDPLSSPQYPAAGV